MPTLNKSDRFLKDVVSYVKLLFDRPEIRQELEDHIEDRMLDFRSEGYNNEEALTRAIDSMGNPQDIGRELNMMHKPLLGWIWKISDITVKVVGIIAVLYSLMVLLATLNFSNPLRSIDKDDVVYHMKANEKAKIDSRIIQVTDILYENDGTMHIRFKTYGTSIFINNWNFSSIGVITDDVGSEYWGNGGSSGGIVSYSHVEIEDFPEDSQTLNIVFDRYNRHYEFHFDLEEGGLSE